jgi:invasion protein IalB
LSQELDCGAEIVTRGVATLLLQEKNNSAEAQQNREDTVVFSVKLSGFASS